MTGRAGVVAAALLTLIGVRAGFYGTDSFRDAPGHSVSLVHAHPGLAYAIELTAAVALAIPLISLVIAPADAPGVTQRAARWCVALVVLLLVLVIAALPAHPKGFHTVFGGILALLASIGGLVAAALFASWTTPGERT